MKKRTTMLMAVLLAAPAAAMEPGMWTTTGKTVDIDIALPPGVPASMRDMIKSQMTGQSYSQDQCITQADLDEAPEKMFQESEGKCEYERFDMSGGKLDAVAVCKMQGQTMQMVMTGTHSDNDYQTRMTMTGQGQMGNMTIITEGSGTRTGDC
ncbi:DUF3617 domain-containing protein [Pacificimonas sp. ICDLI1SI03]|jgi:hypothetical protein|tara:strand:- start:72350 stop:72808 length:459 start_codon:yes stop_codon:yes gene_type:complete